MGSKAYGLLFVGAMVCAMLSKHDGDMPSAIMCMILAAANLISSEVAKIREQK